MTRFPASFRRSSVVGPVISSLSFDYLNIHGWYLCIKFYQYDFCHASLVTGDQLISCLFMALCEILGHCKLQIPSPTTFSP